jgi:hypothetical protein
MNEPDFETLPGTGDARPQAAPRKLRECEADVHVLVPVTGH